MSTFRNHTPERRKITVQVKSYTDHRSDLKLDYKDRCGYCNDIDTWRFVWFEIDHFVPKKHLTSITDSEYSNLVYACRSCNNAKRAQWPTKDEKVHNKDDKGFIDPCDTKYNLQFSRLTNGRIKSQTNLGEWMYNALKFYKPQHEIIWNIEQLVLMIDEIEDLLKTHPNENLSLKLLNSYRGFKQYIEELSRAGF